MSILRKMIFLYFDLFLNVILTITIFSRKFFFLCMEKSFKILKELWTDYLNLLTNTVKNPRIEWYMYYQIII